jgi:F420-0:gamma-glutamyl ligase
LRAGIIGSALGYAGFAGLKNYRNKKDLFGRTFQFSSVNIADCLATAAVLVMGEGAERQPLAIIKNPPVKFCRRISKKELLIDLKDDIYLPLLKNVL